jgi:hypothetical protein
MALFIPAAARAQNTESTSTAQAEANQMVSASVALKQTVDSARVKQGDPIQTILAKRVSLKNGTELPAGTAIVGVVTTDDMELTGKSKLALNFTEAKLKNGTVVPIEATILGVFPPLEEDISNNPVRPDDLQRGIWGRHPDTVDQVDALPGVDLHSRVSSSNSGVLVSNSNHDLKLKSGSEIALEIAPQQSGM